MLNLHSLITLEAASTHYGAKDHSLWRLRQTAKFLRWGSSSDLFPYQMVSNAWMSSLPLQACSWGDHSYSQFYSVSCEPHPWQISQEKWNLMMEFKVFFLISNFYFSAKFEIFGHTAIDNFLKIFIYLSIFDCLGLVVLGLSICTVCA